jgi:hypothetical protein
MTDKLSDKEIERRKQASLKAPPPKPHEAMLAQNKGGKGPKPAAPKARNFRHQGR